MKVFGLESISQELATDGYFVKCIFNSSVAIFFQGTVQHRDIKRDGVSYEDDYRGNAMAATITPGRIDIRFHRAYSDDSVRLIFQKILSLPELNWASEFLVLYQGRLIF